MKCSSQFSCGSLSEGGCWCASLPNIVSVAAQDCLCKPCLITQINNQIEQFLETEKASKLDFIKYQTSELVEGIDFYIESGMYVFTKWYHLKRGYCCNSGCRHCPYRASDT
ncbi:MAG: DUF5522 domain-containing protein [Cyclobacteriaceae bacterium]